MRFRGLVVALAGVVLLTACDSGDQTEDVAEPAAPVAAPPVTAADPAPTPVDPTPAAPGPAAAAPPAPAAVPVEPAAAPAAVQPAAAAAEGTYVGTAEAIEADVILVDGTRILLFGVDAVEPPQTCFIDGQPWECWPAAMRQLQTYIGEGPTTCTGVRPPDIFGRILALCEVGGESLNERMIRSGFAVAVLDEVPEYAAAEEAARNERVGLWQGQFQLPEEWRLNRGIQVRRP
ncbi:MAG: thermonuclease family protein [Bauldia sp.]